MPLEPHVEKYSARRCGAYQPDEDVIQNKAVKRCCQPRASWTGPCHSVQSVRLRRPIQSPGERGTWYGQWTTNRACGLTDKMYKMLCQDSSCLLKAPSCGSSIVGYHVDVRMSLPRAHRERKSTWPAATATPTTWTFNFRPRYGATNRPAR